jgi:hypothetical protein
MSAQLQIVLIAAGCTGAVGLAGMVIVRLLRRAPLRLAIQASGTVPVLAIVAGTLASAEAMFLSQHDLGVVVMVCVVAGVAAFAFSWLLGRQVASGSTALRQAARSLGDETGQFRPPVQPLAAEFAALSRELADTSAKTARLLLSRLPSGRHPAGRRRGELRDSLGERPADVGSDNAGAAGYWYSHDLRLRTVTSADLPAPRVLFSL